MLQLLLNCSIVRLEYCLCYGTAMRIDQPINKQFFIDRRLRFFILGLMVTAFMFGFADQVWDKNFERLHIFLFNLCAGG